MIANGHYYECACPTSYSGYRCDIPLISTPPPEVECMNNGTSNDGSSSPNITCECTLGNAVRSRMLVPVPLALILSSPHCIVSTETPSGYACRTIANVFSLGGKG